jgi:outer membrane murein-binding lipoprotein Lpp
MAQLGDSEEKELMAGIEQMLREMLVSKLEAISKQVATLSATVDRIETGMREAMSRLPQGQPWI